MKRLIAIVPAVVFVLLLVGFVIGLQRDPSKLPSMLIGKPAPAFNLPGIREGDAGFASTDLPREPAMVNVFASWCAPCLIEHPELMRLRASGVPIYGLNWKDEPEAGAGWLARYGDPYIRVGSDRTGRTAIDLGVTGAPETFIIDKQGKIRYRHVGIITPQVWSETLGPLMQKLRSES